MPDPAAITEYSPALAPGFFMEADGNYCQDFPPRQTRGFGSVHRGTGEWLLPTLARLITDANGGANLALAAPFPPRPSDGLGPTAEPRSCRGSERRSESGVWGSGIITRTRHSSAFRLFSLPARPPRNDSTVPAPFGNDRFNRKRSGFPHAGSTSY